MARLAPLAFIRRSNGNEGSPFFMRETFAVSSLQFLIYFNGQFFKLLRLYRARSVGHKVGSVLNLRERDNVLDVVRLA